MILSTFSLLLFNVVNLMLATFFNTCLFGPIISLLYRRLFLLPHVKSFTMASYGVKFLTQPVLTIPLFRFFLLRIIVNCLFSRNYSNRSFRSPFEIFTLDRNSFSLWSGPPGNIFCNTIIDVLLIGLVIVDHLWLLRFRLGFHFYQS